MGERAAGYDVRADALQPFDILFRDVARNFDERPARNAAHRFAHHFVRHVVEHDDVRARFDGIVHLFERLRLHLDLGH